MYLIQFCTEREYFGHTIKWNGEAYLDTVCKVHFTEKLTCLVVYPKLSYLISHFCSSTGNLWKSIEVHGDPWNPMEFMQSMEILRDQRSPWKSMQSAEIYVINGNSWSRWKSMESNGNPWNPWTFIYGIHGKWWKPWKSMESVAHGLHGHPWNTCKSMGIDWNPWESIDLWNPW